MNIPTDMPRLKGFRYPREVILRGLGGPPVSPEHGRC
jgi:hypothetical protein